MSIYQEMKKEPQVINMTGKTFYLSPKKTTSDLSKPRKKKKKESSTAKEDSKKDKDEDDDSDEEGGDDGNVRDRKRLQNRRLGASAPPKTKGPKAQPTSSTPTNTQKAVLDYLLCQSKKGEVWWAHERCNPSQSLVVKLSSDDREKKVFQQLPNCEYVVKAYASCHFHNKFALILEQLNEKLPLTLPLISTALCHILKALNHCHQHMVIHRDVKPEHIMWSKPRNCFVLIDFDLAKVIKPTSKLKSENIGTSGYQAPELFENPNYSELIDIWSLGATILHMLCRVLDRNFLREKHNQRALCELLGSLVSEGSCKDLSSILGLMIQMDPQKRASASLLLAKISDEAHSKEELFDICIS